MNLYDTINQKQLNSIIYTMLQHFNLVEELGLSELASDYCTLTIDLGDNQQSDSEYIITEDFTVNYSNPQYSNIDYNLLLRYYDLQDGDIDDSHEYDSLKEKTIKLTTGENTISFDEPIVYLQQECTLIIKNNEG